MKREKKKRFNNEAVDDDKKLAKSTRNKKSHKYGSGLIEFSFRKIFIQETPHFTKHYQQKQCFTLKCPNRPLNNSISTYVWILYSVGVCTCWFCYV